MRILIVEDEQPAAGFEVIVSQDRAGEFKAWLER